MLSLRGTILRSGYMRTDGAFLSSQPCLRLWPLAAGLAALTCSRQTHVPPAAAPAVEQASGAPRASAGSMSPTPRSGQAWDAGNSAANADPSDRWPSVEVGRWEISSEVRRRSGRLQHVTEEVRHCNDSKLLFMIPAADGILDEGGCQFSSSQVSPRDFKLTSACMVRRAGVVRTEASVTVENAQAFEIRIEPRDKKNPLVTQKGRWIGPCEAAGEKGTK